MTHAISVRDLTKRHRHVVAVDSATFTAEPSRVTAVLGPNGSGKTSILRIVAGLDRPTTGVAHVGDRLIARHDDPAGVLGALVEGPAVHPSWRAGEHLSILAASLGLSGQRVRHVARECGVEPFGFQRGRSLSLGMRQRLGIAMAVLADPVALILDEPAIGLDPEAMRWLRRLVKEKAASGRTVLFSSHLMAEVEGLADDVVILQAGRVVWSPTLEQFMRAHTVATSVVATLEPDRLSDALARAGAQVRRQSSDLVVTGIEREAVGGVAFSIGTPVTELRSVTPSLEDVYLDFVASIGAHPASPRGELMEVAA